MKKGLNNNLIVTKCKTFPNESKLHFPFDKKLLKLLKLENKYQQEYFYVENNNDYAYIIIYKMKMNIFTFGKLNLSLNTSVIGYPCSLSEEGFITNNQNLVLDFAKTIKGPVLVLNVKNVEDHKDFVLGETLPTCIFYNNFKNESDYLNNLRSSYRRRIKKAIDNCTNFKIKEIDDDSIDIYPLYLNTYNKSNYKLEKLEKGFFDKVEATKLIFMKDTKPMGFVLLKKVKEKLIFMLCGMDYSIDTTDLYYYMLFNIVKYAIKNNCSIIDFGQTSEETKLKFGASLEKRYFYAHHSNKFINYFVKHGRSLLEYKYKFPKYHVLKEDKNESSIV